MPTLYQIQGINQDNPYNIKNFGKEIVSNHLSGISAGGASFEKRVRPTISKDYDEEFTKRLIEFTPAYDAEEFLEYHFGLTDYDPSKWLKHIEYEILTNSEFSKKGKEHYKKLVSEWLEKKKEDIKNALKKKMEEFYYDFPSAKSAEDADWKFVTQLTIICADSEMTLRKVPTYLENHYNWYAESNMDKKLVWLEYTRDLIKKNHKPKTFSDAALNWIAKQLDILKITNVNTMTATNPLNETVIKNAKTDAKRFDRKYRGTPNEAQREYDIAKASLENLPSSEKLLYLNTFISQINILIEEHVCTDPKNCLPEKNWYDALLWATKQLEINNGIEIKEQHIGDKYNIKWKDKKSNLIELIYALIESGTITYSKKEDVVKAFAEFFNFELKNPDQALQAIKNKRNDDNPTILLDKLKKSFIDYLNKEE